MFTEQNLQHFNAVTKQCRQKYTVAAAAANAGAASGITFCDYVHCKKSGATMTCKACLSCTYCDKKCQKKDWVLQHRDHCCKTSTSRQPEPESPEQLWRELSELTAMLGTRAKNMAFYELSRGYQDVSRVVLPDAHGVDQKELIAMYCAVLKNGVPEEGGDYEMATIWSEFRCYADSHRGLLNQYENPGKR